MSCCFFHQRVCSNVRMVSLLHCSFINPTAANLFVWTEEMFNKRGMNSSTLNDPFQPRHWKDCGLFDLFDLLSSYCVQLLLFGCLS